ncbi:MAG: HAD family hydrolase [Candidatus Marinimicrobia bacterium]|nr:HAD family hydrolase [Candidatus Neomarinimicrobiota bacterium]MCK4445809.1 HAD family hydrolase [Candidatus Neomarinimicrobiota bacterium]
MEKDFDLIIFDLDGTLYQRSPEIDMVFPKVPIKLAAKSTGKSEEEMQVEFMQKKDELTRLISGNPTSTLTLFHYYDVEFKEFEDEVNKLLNIESILKPDPKAIKAIEKVNKLYSLFLFTTNNGILSNRILKTLKLDKIFPISRRFSLYSVENLDMPKKEKLEYIKPGLRGFEFILNRFGVMPEKTLMVGDSEVSDIIPAKKLGIKTYHVIDREKLYALPEWLGMKLTEVFPMELLRSKPQKG